MTTARKAQAAAVMLIGVAFGVVWIQRRGAQDEAASFAPYAATEEPNVTAGVAPTVAPVPTTPPTTPHSAAEVRRSTNGAGSPAGANIEDTLNRPGPDPAADEERRITNRRPRTAEQGAEGAEPLGRLDKDDIRKGIRAVTPLVKVCYEDSLQEFPDAAGKVTIGFRIIGEDGKGRVEMSELDQEGTTLFDEKLHDCLQKRISEAEFEVPQGGGVVNVRYPFVFATDAETE